MSTVILRATTRVLTPIVLAVSFYYLLRGHDAPGGGFIGALIAGAAVVLQYLANGAEGLRKALPVGFQTLLAIGLLLAVGYGLVGLAVGGQFLEGAIWRWGVPVVGEVKLAASLVFDVGVYLVVLAVIVAVMHSLGTEER